MEEPLNKLVQIAFNSVKEPIVLIEMDGFRVVASNQQYTERLQARNASFPLKDVTGFSLLDLAAMAGMTEEEQVPYTQFITEMIKTRQPVHRIEREWVGGKLKVYSSTLYPIEENGRIIYASYLARDITELEQLNNSLQAVNKQMTEMAKVASHDLKSPLLNIRSLIGFIQECELDDEASLLMEKIAISADRMEETVNALSEVLISTSQDADAIGIDVAQEVSRTLDSVHLQVLEAKAQVRLDFTSCPQLYFSSVRFRSIVQNLLTNSLKYRHPERNLEIELQTTVREGQAVLIHKDNGRGMDLSVHGGKLFGLFQRFHKDIEGSGIGLYLANRFVTEQGGRIEVNSTPNEGAEFRVFFGFKSLANV